MQTSKTFKILFRLIKARKKNIGVPIYVKITVNGKRTEFSKSSLIWGELLKLEEQKLSAGSQKLTGQEM